MYCGPGRTRLVNFPAITAIDVRDRAIVSPVFVKWREKTA